MGILSTIREGLKRALRLTEQTAGGITDPDEGAYRPLSGGNPYDPRENVRQLWTRRLGPHYYFRNAIAGAVIDSRVDRVVGADAELKAADPDVQAAIDRFAGDPDTDALGSLPLYARELEIYGELALPIYLTPENADVRLGYVDPFDLESVIWQRGNAKRALAVIQRPPAYAFGSTTGAAGARAAGGEAQRKSLLWVVPHPSPEFDDHYPPHPALTEEDEPNSVPGLDGLPVVLPSDAKGQVLPEIAEALDRQDLAVAGYAFYHRNNSLVTGRGRSTFERIAEWCKALDDWFFGELRSALLRGLIVAHVKLEGGDNVAITQRKKELQKIPKPGSLIVTNEKETWEFLSAQLPPSGPLKELREGVLKVIGIAVGIPPHEIGAEGDSNRSTAKEAAQIATSRAKRFQKLLAGMVLSWVGYQVDQKVYRGQLPEDADRDVEVVLPELDVKDQAAEAAALQSAVTAMTTAVDSNLVLESDARRYLYSLIGQDCPTDEEFAEAQAAAKQARDETFMAGAGDRLANLLQAPPVPTPPGSPGAAPAAPAAPVYAGNGR